MKSGKLAGAALAFVVLLAMLGTGFAADAAAADEFTIDGKHSSANFSVRHMAIATVHGRFQEVAGTIVYDEKDPSKSSVTAVIKTASITTDNPDRDRDLKSAKFFEVEKYPEITFKSSRVEKRGSGWVAAGTLTMKGVAKEIELPFTITGKNKNGKRAVIGAEAHLTLNRVDYGVVWNRTLEGGGVLVSNEVNIELNIEAVKNEAAAGTPAAGAEKKAPSAARGTNPPKQASGR